MAEPITLDELKAHLRLTHDSQNDLLTALIATAREEVERDTWRGLVDSTKSVILREFPARLNGWVTRDRKIYLPFVPLRTVTAITYRDAAGTTQTLNSNQYVVDTAHEPGTIEPAPNCAWPETQVHPAAVTIAIVCGYATPAAVPPGLKHAVKLIAAKLFNSATPAPLAPAGGGVGTARTTLDRLLEKFRVRRAEMLECV